MRMANIKKTELWDKLIKELNSNGPPTKTAASWKKVWADFKYNAKKKLAYNKKSLKKTGGGPPERAYISPLEETAIVAAGIEAAVEGVPNAKTFGISSTSNTEEEMDFMLGEILRSPSPSKSVSSSCNDNEDNELQTQDVPLKKRVTKNKTEELIKEDISERTDFHTKLLNILKERNEIAKKKVGILEEHTKETLLYRKRKLELRLVKLELLKTRNCECSDRATAYKVK